MKNALFSTVLTVITLWLVGCSTTMPAPVLAPEPAPVVPPTLLETMQTLTAEVATAGGLAALGIDESKSQDLALNMAKKNGRIELARALNTRIEALARAFSEETGVPYESLLLSGFNHAAATITKQQIVGSIAQTLKHEKSGDTFTAYAIMVLDPQAIADQLAKETDLYPRLQPTQAFKTLTQEIKTYEAFKAAQQ